MGVALMVSLGDVLNCLLTMTLLLVSMYISTMAVTVFCGIP